MSDERDDGGEIEGGLTITGEMSEEAIFNAAVANDAHFMARLDDLYDYFVDIGKRASASTAFTEAQSAFGNAMTIANSIHSIALVREKFTRDRLDKHPNRADLELDGDDDLDIEVPDDDAVEEL